jgi:hypothetical protein
VRGAKTCKKLQKPEKPGDPTGGNRSHGEKLCSLRFLFKPFPGSLVVRLFPGNFFIPE